MVAVFHPETSLFFSFVALLSLNASGFCGQQCLCTEQRETSLVLADLSGFSDGSTSLSS